MPIVPLRAFRPLMLVVLALGTVTGVAACGGGTSQSDIEKKIDAASVGEENVADGASASELAQEQVDKDSDAKAAAEAVKRRQELAKIEKEQAASAQAVEDGKVPSDQSGPDIEEQKFRARLAGVCEGAQTRITKVSKAADAAQKSKDPNELLKVAQDYNDALNDFLASLKAIDAPASEQALYSSWLGTIDDLSNTIRLQLVSAGDAKESARLQAKTTKLTTQFLTETAQLGVTCFSVTT